MRLLVIDDDPDLVTSVTTVMEGAGWEVHSAANGAEGLEKARLLRPELIILDILMPRKDGLSTYEELRADAALKAIPIIMLTSAGEKLGFGFSSSDMAAHYGHEPEAFLQKPFEPAHLVETARRVTRPRA
jgi:two-component system alkaline phosphatase synthesis response regulator PhoP